MKITTPTFNKRLNKFDPQYFDKEYKPIVDEKGLIQELVLWLQDSGFDVSERGWKSIMQIRSLFPEIYWTVLEICFCGYNNEIQPT